LRYSGIVVSAASFNLSLFCFILVFPFFSRLFCIEKCRYVPFFSQFLEVNMAKHVVVPRLMVPMAGMSVVEILVALAVAAVLLAIGVPQYQTIVKDTQVSSTVNEFIAANAFARAEAIKRNRLVTICRALNADTGTDFCSKAATDKRHGDDWAAGWLIFVEGDSAIPRIGNVDGEDEILVRQGEFSTATVSNSTMQQITYNGMGEPINLRGGSVKFHIDGDARRMLCIARTGRIRVVRDVDHCAV
jgi:type IV fimbrial biogenesis protein FimT